MDFFFFFLRVLISRFVTFDECFFNCIKFDSSGGGGLHRQCKVRVYVVLVARACFLAPTLFLFCFQVLVCLFMRNDL